jgi:hypothetical protein
MKAGIDLCRQQVAAIAKIEQPVVRIVKRSLVTVKIRSLIKQDAAQFHGLREEISAGGEENWQQPAKVLHQSMKTIIHSLQVRQIVFVEILVRNFFRLHGEIFHHCFPAGAQLIDQHRAGEKAFGNGDFFKFLEERSFVKLAGNEIEIGAFG